MVLSHKRRVDIAAITAIVLGALRLLSSAGVILYVAPHEMHSSGIAISNALIFSIVGAATIYLGLNIKINSKKRVEYLSYLVVLYVCLLGYSFASLQIGGQGSVSHIVVTGVATAIFESGRRATVETD